MIISLRLLKKYIPLKESVGEIVNALTMAGIEVEELIDLGVESQKILIGEVKEVSKHPSAEKLSVCKVSIGADKPVLNIVCGAPNVAAGQRVPVALAGATLPTKMKIEKTTIRGVESEGMLCSGKEIKYNEDDSGILVLPKEWTIGEPLDCLIDIKVTPNRADCLSIIGVARDLAAIYKRKVNPPVPKLHETMDKIEMMAKVTVENKEACPKYTCRLIRGVKIGPSPLWLKCAVESCGMRSINNVVDVTNFVLTELGHPLHAFDFDKITDHHIIVRFAKNGEEITTLDNQPLKLSEKDLLITDPAKPIALAGIMGGLYSEIDTKTINVLLESAYFDPVTIRRSSKRLEKSTDSSYRFERGTDIKNLTLALNRASQLIKEVAGGEIAKGIIDVSGKISKPQLLSLSIDTLNKTLGTKLTVREVADELVSLGFELLRCDKNLMSFNVPSFRVDIKREVDLIEEVARIYGYNKIPTAVPYIPSRHLSVSPLQKIQKKIRESFVELGFNEAITYSFVNKDRLQIFDKDTDKFIEVKNPISKDQGVMRTNLITEMLKRVSHNMNYNTMDLRLFEIGKTFKWNDKKTEPVETEKVVAVISGSRFSSWNLPQGDVDFFDIKGAAEYLLKSLGITGAAISKIDAAANIYYNPYRSAAFMLGNDEIIKFGELHPDYQEQLDIKKKVYILEADVDLLVNVGKDMPVFEELPKFPGVARDLAILVGKEIPVADIIREIKKVSGTDLVNISVFDLYEGEQVPQGKKSIAFSLFYQSREKTLSEDVIAKHQADILSALKEKFSAILR